MRALLAAILLAPVLAFAAAVGVPLDRAPVELDNLPSLQRGAQIFVNYCQNCHSATYMRYNRMQDLGLTLEQIRDNLMFAGERVGDPMTVAMRPKEAAQWFGAAPPDLSLIARSRGADWLYTYLRTFYRDPSRPLGWNNLVYPNVAMPHVLYQLQGVQTMELKMGPGPHGGGEASPQLVLQSPGALTPVEYERLVGDLVNFLVYMSEPAGMSRTKIGISVLLFLTVFIVVAWFLKRVYWRDVH